MKRTLYTLWLLVMAALLPVTASAQYTLAKGDRIETSDGVYIVKGDNLVTNGFFTDGLNGWVGGDGKDLSSSSFSVTATGGPDGGAFLCANGNGGSSSSASLKTGWAVAPGTLYVLNMWSKNCGQYVYLCSSSSATTANSNNTLVDISSGGEWTQTQAVFEANNDYVVLNGGWLGSSARFACVTICEVELSAELVYTTLDNAITAAEQLLASTEEGTGRGQYTAEVRQVLADAIAAAQGVRASATAQTEVTEAAKALEKAASQYQKQVNPPFNLTKKYWIQHVASDAYLTASSTVKVHDDSGEPNQVFHFAWAPEGAVADGYNLISEDGQYVYRSGSWDTKAGTVDATTANAIFTIDDHDTFVQLRNAGSGSVLGTDATTAGATVYSNKNGTDQRNQWRLIEYVSPDDQDDEFLFNRALQQLTSLYALADSKSSLCGPYPFDYSQDAYDALKQAYEHAQTVTTDFATETAAIEQAIADYNANAIVRPNTSKQYVITQMSGKVLAYEEGNSSPVLQTADGSDRQKFTFVQTVSGYALCNVATGRFVGKSSSSAWTMVWADDYSAGEAQWVVAATDNTYKGIQNVAGKGYIGSDATTDGSPTYCDKGSSANNSKWTIEEYSIAAALEKAIVQAQKVLAEAEVGTEYYQVPQSAYDALAQAIATAQGTTVTTAEEAQTAADVLKAAVARFQQSYNPLQPFDTSITYNIVHRGGMVLSAATAQVTIQKLETEDPDKALVQQFELVAVEGSEPVIYRIRNVETGLFVGRTGAYNTEWVALADTTAQQFYIKQTSGRYLGLQFIGEGTFLGTDGTSAGQIAYSDKVASNTNAQWLVQPAEAITTIDKTALRSALDAAKEFGNTMKAGNLKGEFYQADIDAFKQALAGYEAAYRTCRTDEAVAENTAAVNALVTDYQAKAHAADIDILTYAADLVADAEAALAAAKDNIGVDKGQYTQDAYDEFAQYVADFKQNPTIEVMNALKARTAAFRQSVVKVDRTALGTAIATAETYYAGLTIGEFDGQTSASAANELSRLIGEAKNLYGAPTAHSQSDLNTMKASLEAAIRECQAQTVTIQFAAIDAAQQQLQALFSGIPADRVGNSDEKVDPAAYATASEVLDELAAIDRKAISQNDVDRFVEECEAAQRQLQQAIKEASQLDMLIGDCQDLYDTEGINLSPIQRATFRHTVESAQELLDADYVTWDELMAMAAKLEAARDTFKELADGIYNVVSPDAQVRVYDLNGQLVGSGLCGEVVKHLRPYKIYVVNGRKVMIK
ncbi:MAG: RICIN domain-containing protein [Bacteroidaceae bacterium]|nr:RICIN domain-containing protein [Bacteroidaceae bacterium]